MAVGRTLFAMLVTFTALLQASLFPAMDVLAVMPNFALVFLLIWSSGHGVEEGLIWAFGLGIWLDLLTLDRLGTHAIALLPVAIVGGLVSGRFFRSGAILPIIAVIVATVAFTTVKLGISLMAGEAGDVLASVRLALIASLLNVLVVPLAYGALIVFERWTPRRVV
jgi:rod shape-determining protein MreD